MTPLTQALLRAVRMVAHGSALRDLATSRSAFVELRDVALRPGYRTSAVERVCLRALARFHARYNEQARREVCTVVTFGALLRAALADADRNAGDDAPALAIRDRYAPLDAMAYAMSVVAVAQGTGPLLPRCTLGSTDGRITVGDFEMGPWRHDGRWRLARDDRGIRLVEIDCGRRLARRIATHALEIALGSTAGLRDIRIEPTPEGYALSGRARSASATLRMATIGITASGIIDWPSFTYAAASPATTESPEEPTESATTDVAA
jgi:hypothetical protein